MITIQTVLNQYFLFSTSENGSDPNLEFEFLYSLDLDNIVYPREALNLLFLNLERRGYLWNWYHSGIFCWFPKTINAITGYMPEIYLNVLARHFQSLSMGHPANNSGMFSHILSSILEVFTPYLNSTSRNLTGPIREIINIIDMDDFNRFMNYSRSYNYSGYVHKRNYKDEGLNLENLYHIERSFLKLFNISLLSETRQVNTYSEWVGLIMGRVDRLYSQLKPYLDAHSEHRRELSQAIPPLLVSYVNHLIQEPEREMIDKSIFFLQELVEWVLIRQYSIIEGTPLVELNQYLSNARRDLGVPDNGIISELFNVFEQSGSFVVGVAHIRDIFKVLDNNFPQLSNPGNLEIIKGVNGAKNGPMALILILTGILDRDSPTPWKELFREIFSNPQRGYVPDSNTMSYMGFSGYVMYELNKIIPFFYMGVKKLDIFIKCIGMITYNSFFMHNGIWDRILSNGISNIYNHIEIMSNYIGFILPRYMVDNSEIFNEVLMNISRLILDYFRDRPDLSFTGLRVFDDRCYSCESDMESVSDYIVNGFNMMTSRMRQSFDNLPSTHALKYHNVCSIYYLSWYAPTAVVEILDRVIPSKYRSLVRRLVSHFANEYGFLPDMYKFDSIYNRLEPKSSTDWIIILIIIGASLIFLSLVLGLILFYTL